jgi:large subunit ribosomal protein L9
MLWSRGGESQVEALRRGREVREIADVGQARDVAGQLAGLRITLPSRAGQGGRLFGSVTAADIVAAVTAAGGPALDKRRVELPSSHIKTLGTHAVSVRLHPEVLATMDVDVVAS